VKPEPPNSDAVSTLENLVRQAEKAGASDIHLQMQGPAAEISFRLDGLLSPASRLGPDLADRVVGRIKFLARLKTYQESLPQDGRIEKSEIKSSHDIRVATYPTVTGEKIVLRLFSTGAGRPLEDLGLPAPALDAVKKFLGQSAGLLLLTGPAGSGKTTTIYACLRHLAAGGGRHIITIEDPVEQVLPGLMQTEINEARGLDFATAARHLLRQDPQILVIGEIRPGGSRAPVRHVPGPLRPPLRRVADSQPATDADSVRRLPGPRLRRVPADRIPRPHPGGGMDRLR
jgi:general secretion pathway protein E